MNANRFIETLINALTFGEVSLRLEALEMIQKYYEKAYFALLLHALKDTEEIVRKKAIIILAFIDDERAESAIRSAQNDQAESVREQVKKILNRL